MSNEALSNALGIEPTEILLPSNALQVTHEFDANDNLVPVNTPEDNISDRKEDYVLSRETFRDLITKGNSAIEGISDLAKMSDSPRAYEVLANLIKTVSDTTKELMVLQKNFKELSGSTEKKRVDESVVNVDKAVFLGTTSELLKQIKSESR